MVDNEKLDQIRMIKLVKRGWKCIASDTLIYPNRFLIFVREEEFEKLKGYPKNSAAFKYAADFVYDTVEKKFIKQSVEINITPAEMVLYGR